MSITIQFENVPTGLFQTYGEQGFNFSTEVTQNQGYPDAFWNRAQITDLGTGGYLINQYASDTVVLKPAAGGLRRGLDRHQWVQLRRLRRHDADHRHLAGRLLLPGVKADGNVVTFQAPTTDAIDGFQTIALPVEFGSGLTQLRWFVVGGTGWGAFDNLVLNLNTAPDAQAFTGAVTAGELFTGQLVATDADGQALIYSAVGTLPAGVVVDADGRFYVQPLAGDADLTTARTVSFEYRAFDGADYSDTETVTVTLNPVGVGPDIRGGNHPQTLVGTSRGEKIWGGNSGDTLGLGGADTLDGANGTDVLMGGDGKDKLIGGNGSDSLDGGAGADVLDGGNGTDTLAGGAGDDVLKGGASPDRFVFGVDFGRDTITDFDAKNEVIQMSPAMFGSFDELKAHAVQAGAHVVITYDTNHVLTLQNVKLSALDADNFLFF
ncbi:calcium-binding protein [Phenylobacterium sp. J367]|uniref:calcium-binding protein n=1 Tax=Phenylobacterium sp. J367 TaxID=2898435 RepID=UPI002150B9BD|nr:calcium-binding protein [Phenylobacterium sp. J367]MCR5880548.1 hypothetical protein [Phenylobacterium sp. J367]